MHSKTHFSLDIWAIVHVQDVLGSKVVQFLQSFDDDLHIILRNETDR